MRIFAKKAFRFRGGDKAVSVAALSFADVPDWVKKDPIFALAVKEGSIELINSKADERSVEKQGTARGSRGKRKDDAAEGDQSTEDNQETE
jgi:hypothetical protein